MTLYLLDANVLIRAHADYYPMDRIPAFWSWLLSMATADVIKMPLEIYHEVTASADMLGTWLKRSNVKNAIILEETTNGSRVRRIIVEGYAPDLNDVELEEIGRDPFLVAAALGGPDRVVVTREASGPSKKRANRKLPDVCAQFSVPVINDFALYRALNFSIA
ncbi:MAG TPA: DUF4411 family protein [Stellaceae bacterium]|nr:DUF4411 family protein [Stellaceae bacterium]